MDAVEPQIRELLRQVPPQFRSRWWRQVTGVVDVACERPTPLRQRYFSGLLALPIEDVTDDGVGDGSGLATAGHLAAHAGPWPRSPALQAPPSAANTPPDAATKPAAAKPQAARPAATATEAKPGPVQKTAPATVGGKRE